MDERQYSDPKNFPFILEHLQTDSEVAHQLLCFFPYECGERARDPLPHVLLSFRPQQTDAHPYPNAIDGKENIIEIDEPHWKRKDHEKRQHKEGDDNPIKQTFEHECRERTAHANPLRTGKGVPSDNFTSSQRQYIV